MIHIKVEDVAEILKEFVNDRYLVFMGFEEAKTIGSNIIDFVIDISEKVSYSAIFFEYAFPIDEVYPIALVMQFAKEVVKDLPLSLVHKALDKYRGYIYGSGNDMGILIPIDSETEIPIVLGVAIPEIMKMLFNCEVRPRIVGYEAVY